MGTHLNYCVRGETDHMAAIHSCLNTRNTGKKCSTVE